MEENKDGQDDKPPEEDQQKSQLMDNPLFAKSVYVKNDGDEAKSESSEIEEELNPEEDFRLCGEKIQNCLFEGAEIPD